MRASATVAFLLLAACGSSDDGPATSPLGPVDPTPQRDGDAEAGYTALVNGGYVGCGVPYSAYQQVAGPAPDAWRAPGRNERNADMPYFMTRFTTAEGVDVVSPNCLQCHGEFLNGELVIGLGNHTTDYTDDIGTYALLSGGLVKDPVEHAEWERWKDRVVAISSYVMTDTVGVNPADNLAAVLFAHRDPKTLEWSNEPRIELPPPVVVPVDVPPWWHMKRKNAMFYLAAGRGDHARIMMTASTLCVETVEEAREVDAYFPDVRAYILSLEAPAWPHEVDAELASQGREIFDTTCARCHGTYGAGGDYPNLVIGLDEVGTDDTLATGTAQFADAFVDWFNGSFYGEMAELAPAEGYIAPPLDGIWATAPYFHNGSVPTLAAVLDSASRPRYWTRSFDTSDYDVAALGWNYTQLSHSRDDEPDINARKLIYDTTRLGYSNAGHTFGDGLDAAERAALLEYLKTL
jgi:mono/diheme cytochrome c family protein